jgi:hypothetical protein
VAPFWDPGIPDANVEALTVFGSLNVGMFYGALENSRTCMRLGSWLSGWEIWGSGSVRPERSGPNAVVFLGLWVPRR